MKKYYVALEVIFYDNEPSCEPFVEEMKEESEVQNEK